MEIKSLLRMLGPFLYMAESRVDMTWHVDAQKIAVGPMTADARSSIELHFPQLPIYYLDSHIHVICFVDLGRTSGFDKFFWLVTSCCA